MILFEENVNEYLLEYKKGLKLYKKINGNSKYKLISEAKSVNELKEVSNETKILLMELIN